MRKTEKDLKTDPAGEGILPGAVQQTICKIVSTGAEYAQEIPGEFADNIKAVSVKTVRTATRTASFLYSMIDIIVGICFIVTGLWILQFYFENDLLDYLEALDWIMVVVYIFGGLVMIFNPRRTFNSSIGIYAMVIAVNKTINSWIEMGETESDYIFLYYFVMFLFAINLIISGSSYLRLKPRGTLGMTFNAAVVLVADIIAAFYMVRIEGMTFHEVFDENPTMLIELFLFSVFLLMLDSQSSRELNTKERLSRSTDVIRRTKTISDASYVYLPEAAVACDPTRRLWGAPDCGGPVEKECIVCAHSKNGPSYIFAQIWKGSEKIHLTISDHSAGSIVKATRMEVDRMFMNEDGSSMIIEGSNEFRLVFDIRVPLNEYKIVRSVPEASQ